MATVRDWQRNRDTWVRVLEKENDENLDCWNQRIRETPIADESGLRTWLDEQRATGYPQSLLVIERFGYSDEIPATAEELIEQQYADRRHLRPVYDEIINLATACAGIVIQARRTYVSLVAPKRTFARIQPRKTRVDLGLRLENCRPGGRLEPSRIHHTMRVQIGLTTRDEVDDEVRRLLAQAYLENS